jgi:hypothetical protein
MALDAMQKTTVPRSTEREFFQLTPSGGKKQGRDHKSIFDPFPWSQEPDEINQQDVPPISAEMSVSYAQG